MRLAVNSVPLLLRIALWLPTCAVSPVQPQTDRSLSPDLRATVGTGQPLALLLKQETQVTDLRLYDIRLAADVASDVVYNPKRLFGVITLDVNRASTFLSGIANFKPAKVAHGFFVSAGEQCEKCVHRIQFGGDELVKVKDGAGTATLSMAYAAADFSGDLIRALRPERRERTVSSSAHIHVQQSDSESRTFPRQP
ncbi:unnamed protein product [Tilletia laevis]|uniref:Lactate/malate dehydrogenase C-terminal domain-containing protein n=1 Tax=Tilletia laevis TaxID=157183 RepID=A0A9N8LIZ8_9BASI|nr:unnamed protein product [Tilletia laevis]